MEFDKGIEYNHVCLTRFINYVQHDFFYQQQLIKIHIGLFENELLKIEREFGNESDSDLQRQYRNEIELIERIKDNFLIFCFTNSWKILEDNLEQLFFELTIYKEISSAWSVISDTNTANKLKKFFNSLDISFDEQLGNVLIDFYTRRSSVIHTNKKSRKYISNKAPYIEDNKINIEYIDIHQKFLLELSENLCSGLEIKIQ